MEKSTGMFALYFKKLIMEDITAGDAGVGSSDSGFSSTSIKSGDFYAPGDARVPKALGKVQQRSTGPKKKRKKKKKIKKIRLSDESEESKVTMVKDISNYM